MNKLLIGGAAAVLGVAAIPAVAQPAPPRPPGVAQGTAPVLPSPHLQPTLMRNMAGRTVTRDEVIHHVRELFARLDTNHDGFVTRNEVEAAQGQMMMSMHGGEPGMGMEMRDPSAMFDRLDTNHDGVISRQEFIAAHSKMRERRGSMHDGNARGHMHGMGMVARLFEMSDTNHDGRVSLEEAETAALANFDRADLNHDGKLTPEERRQAHRLMMHRPQHPG